MTTALAAPLLPPHAPPSQDAVWFDIADLCAHLRHSRNPTGIQRVQLNLVAAALALAGDRVRICACDPQAMGWKPVPAPLFHRLAQLMQQGGGIADPAWVEAVQQLQRQLRLAPPIAFAPGSVLVNCGTSWWLPEYPRLVRAARARFGLRHAAFVNDCVPLLLPDACAEGLPAEYARWFASLALHADLLIAISDSTRRDLLRLQQRLLPGMAIDAAVVRLDAAPPPVSAAPLSAALRPQRPYVLFVATLEPRKDHALAFRAWQALIARHGLDAVPDLLCVGRRGWGCDALLALHAQTPELRARVRLLHDVSDQQLPGLYAQALFTLYNSRHEGWGLPVTESLAHGKVPVIPAHSSLPEAGGEAAVYFTPGSEPDLVASLEPMIFDAGFRATREARLLASRRLRRWDDIAAQVLDLVAAAPLPGIGAPVIAVPPAALAPRPGRRYRTALPQGTEPHPDMLVLEAMREAGWHAMEDWGSWTRPGLNRLRLPLHRDLRGAGMLRLCLELRSPPAGARCRVRLWQEGAEEVPFRPLRLVPAVAHNALLRVMPDGEGDLLLDIDSLDAARPGGDDRRAVGIGLQALMLCAEDDLASRLHYLEARQPQWTKR